MRYLLVFGACVGCVVQQEIKGIQCTSSPVGMDEWIPFGSMRILKAMETVELSMRFSKRVQDGPSRWFSNATLCLVGEDVDCRLASPGTSGEYLFQVSKNSGIFKAVVFAYHIATDKNRPVEWQIGTLDFGPETDSVPDLHPTDPPKTYPQGSHLSPIFAIITLGPLVWSSILWFRLGVNMRRLFASRIVLVTGICAGILVARVYCLWIETWIYMDIFTAVSRFGMLLALILVVGPIHFYFLGSSAVHNKG